MGQKKKRGGRERKRKKEEGHAYTELVFTDFGGFSFSSSLFFLFPIDLSIVRYLDCPGMAHNSGNNQDLYVGYTVSFVLVNVGLVSCTPLLIERWTPHANGDQLKEL